MYPRFHATKRYDLIEVQITLPSTQTKFQIPDQPQLRSDTDADIAIQAIETFTIFDTPLSPNNVPVASDVQVQATYLTLYVDFEESIYRVPLIQFHRMAGTANAGGNPIPFIFDLQKFKNLYVDWSKSYFLTPVAYAGATFSFLLGVHYYKLPPGTLANINKAEEQNFCSVLPKY